MLGRRRCCRLMCGKEDVHVLKLDENIVDIKGTEYIFKEEKIKKTPQISFLKIYQRC